MARTWTFTRCNFGDCSCPKGLHCSLEAAASWGDPLEWFQSFCNYELFRHQNFFKKYMAQVLKYQYFPLKRSLLETNSNKTAKYLCLAWLSSKIVFWNFICSFKMENFWSSVSLIIYKSMFDQLCRPVAKISSCFWGHVQNANKLQRHLQTVHASASPWTVFARGRVMLPTKPVMLYIFW